VYTAPSPDPNPKAIEHSSHTPSFSPQFYDRGCAPEWRERAIVRYYLQGRIFLTFLTTQTAVQSTYWKCDGEWYDTIRYLVQPSVINACRNRRVHESITCRSIYRCAVAAIHVRVRLRSHRYHIDISSYTTSQKRRHFLRITSAKLTDLQNSFTVGVGLDHKFGARLYISHALHLKCIATLPCEIQKIAKIATLWLTYLR